MSRGGSPYHTLNAVLRGRVLSLLLYNRRTSRPNQPGTLTEGEMGTFPVVLIYKYTYTYVYIYAINNNENDNYDNPAG